MGSLGTQLLTGKPMKDKDLRTEPKGMNSGRRYIVHSCALPITGVGLRQLYWRLSLGNIEDAASLDIREFQLSFEKFFLVYLYKVLTPLKTY